jgi:hypothetical protein
MLSEVARLGQRKVYKEACLQLTALLSGECLSRRSVTQSIQIQGLVDPRSKRTW